MPLMDIYGQHLEQELLESQSVSNEELSTANEQTDALTPLTEQLTGEPFNQQVKVIRTMYT